jgi:serine/threonine protein phosphatase 1
MSRIFAIGDIHGCSNTFRKMVLEEINLKKSDILYCIGDYIDRGTNSKGVIDLILELRAKGFTIHTLRGNHEQIMMDSRESKEMFRLWMANGGAITLRSFDAISYDDFAPEYKAFFEKTEFYLTVGRYIFVHAGLNFGSADPFADKESMLWIRGFEIDDQQLGDRIIIHGHTPTPLDTILAQDGKRVINIDGGCVYKQRDGLGNLIGLNVTEGKFIVVGNVD